MEQRETVENTKMGMLARLKSKHNRRLVTFLLSFITLLFVLLVGWWLFNTYFDSGNSEQFSEYRSDYNDFKKNKPTTTQKTALAEYYQLLASKAAKAGEYEGAISAYEGRRKVLGDKTPVNDSLELAVFYCRMEDKEEAVQAIQEGSTRQNATALDKDRFERAIKAINEQGCDAWVSPLDQQ